MFKHIITILGSLVMLSSSGAIYADRIINEADITIHCSVDSQFGMEIWEDDLIQELPEVTPGEATSGDIMIMASSNRSKPWSIKASCIGLTGSSKDNSDVLPVVISTYKGDDELKGTFFEDIELSETPRTIYSSGETEISCAGLMVGCMFFVRTKADTREDLYTGKILLTLTE